MTLIISIRKLSAAFRAQGSHLNSYNLQCVLLPSAERTPDAVQLGITRRQNGTQPEYTPFNYEPAALGQLLWRAF